MPSFLLKNWSSHASDTERTPIEVLADYLGILIILSRPHKGRNDTALAHMFDEVVFYLIYVQFCPLLCLDPPVRGEVPRYGLVSFEQHGVW